MKKYNLSIAIEDSDKDSSPADVEDFIKGHFTAAGIKILTIEIKEIN